MRCNKPCRTFFLFVTKHAFDRRTDGQTDGILIARPRLHSMQRGKKIELILVAGIACAAAILLLLFVIIRL